MEVSVIRPSLLEKKGYDKTSIFVIIDTFRATTTLSTLKNSGANKFHIVENKDDAKVLRKEYFPNCLLVGEEGGLMIEGFDFGNRVFFGDQDDIWGNDHDSAV